MAPAAVERFVYRNMVQRPKVAKTLDQLGRAINRAGIPYSTGLLRHTSVLHASKNSSEIENSLYQIAADKSGRSNRILEQYFVHFGEIKPSIIGRTLNYFKEDTIMTRTENYMYDTIAKWVRQDRIGLMDFCKIGRELRQGLMPEYLRGFGYHLLIDVAGNFSLAVAGIFLAAGENSVAAGVVISECFLRTAYTVNRMIVKREEHIPYMRALFFGLNPYPGGALAFVVQMDRVSPITSRILIGNTAMGAGRLMCKCLGIRSNSKIVAVENSFLAISDTIFSPVSVVAKKAVTSLKELYYNRPK